MFRDRGILGLGLEGFPKSGVPFWGHLYTGLHYLAVRIGVPLFMQTRIFSGLRATDVP